MNILTTTVNSFVKYRAAVTISEEFPTSQNERSGEIVRQVEPMREPFEEPV